MYTEDDLLPLSGLGHMAFCARRWALIHIECIWEDNQYTAEGTLVHDKAHSGAIESRPGVLIRRTLPLRSLELGISGQADIVEFQPVSDPVRPAVVLPQQRGVWQPFPIEYKRSRDKMGSRAYRIQLCAQAICLEEMLGVAVPEGAIFDSVAKRRQSVLFDVGLRTDVQQLAAEMHRLAAAKKTPPPIPFAACRNCSLINCCCPEALSDFNSASRYLAAQKKACF